MTYAAQCIRNAAIAAAVLLTSLDALAHDFWIEPQKFRAVSGERVGLRLYVGQDFSGETALYNPEQFERYVYAGPSGTQAVAGALGDDPAGSVTPAGPGLYAVGYYSKQFEVRFKSVADFEKYLATEGLERHGAAVIFMARHVAGVRAAVFAVAGIHGMRLPRFVLWDALGACISVPLMTSLGFMASLLYRLAGKPESAARARQVLRLGKSRPRVVAGCPVCGVTPGLARSPGRRRR